jgi:hypothetical protein
MAIMTDNRPDTDFSYRLVVNSDMNRVTWHTLECRTAKNAKFSKRTPFTPDQRNKALNDRCVKATGREPYSLPNNHMAKCCLGRVASSQEQAPTFTATQAARLFAKARASGLAAGNASAPIPMVVGTPATILGNDIDYKKPTYYIPEGACGFAWVVIRPGIVH